MKKLIESKVNFQISKKEKHLEQLLESTKEAVEKSVKEKLQEKREQETLKIFDNFLKEVAKN
jgi:hypothetical protein